MASQTLFAFIMAGILFGIMALVMTWLIDRWWS